MIAQHAAIAECWVGSENHLSPPGTAWFSHSFFSPRGIAVSTFSAASSAVPLGSAKNAAFRAERVCELNFLFGSGVWRPKNQPRRGGSAVSPGRSEAESWVEWQIDLSPPGTARFSHSLFRPRGICCFDFFSGLFSRAETKPRLAPDPGCGAETGRICGPHPNLDHSSMSHLFKDCHAVKDCHPDQGLQPAWRDLLFTSTSCHLPPTAGPSTPRSPRLAKQRVGQARRALHSG